MVVCRSGGEHDLVGERKGLTGPSSIEAGLKIKSLDSWGAFWNSWAKLGHQLQKIDGNQYKILVNWLMSKGPWENYPKIAGAGHVVLKPEVKCKSIEKYQRLLDTFRPQMRRDALKLWKPAEFCERVVVLVEFDKQGSLDGGWRIMRCESYDASGEWKALCGWGGRESLQTTAAVTASGGVKRKREPTTAKSSGKGSSHGHNSSSSSPNDDRKSLFLAGEIYTTLPWYLGRTPVKSEKKLAVACASTGRVDLRHGDVKTLASYQGKEILDETALASFGLHRWVDTTCAKTKPERSRLQVRLLSGSQQPSEPNFLWNFAELQKCLPC